MGPGVLPRVLLLLLLPLADVSAEEQRDATDDAPLAPAPAASNETVMDRRARAAFALKDDAAAVRRPALRPPQGRQGGVTLMNTMLAGEKCSFNRG